MKKALKKFAPLSHFRANPGNTNYFAGALNIFGLLYLIPFKIEWDQREERYFLRTKKLRLAICGGIHITGVFLLAHCAYRRCYSERTESQSQTHGFMEIVHNVDFLTNAAFNLAILHFVWRGQAGLEKFLNIKPIKAARTTQFKVFISTFFYILIFAVDIYTSGFYCSKCISIFHSMSAFTCRPAGTEIIFGVTDWFLFLLIVLATLFMYVGEAVCCSVTLNMWSICRRFQKDLDCDLSFPEGMEVINEHFSAFQTVNQLSSTLLLMQIMTSFVYFCQAPIVLHFGTSYYYKKGTMIAYIFESGIVWVLAGECHALTRQTIKKWIQNRQEKADKYTTTNEQFRLAALSHNLDSDPVALSCSFFNITHRYVASMLGLLISYNIIIFQMEDQGKVRSIRTTTNLTPTPSS